MLNAPPNWPYAPVEAGEDEQPASVQDSSQYFQLAPRQAIGNTDKHRVLVPYPIGTWAQGNRNSSITPGLAPGQTVTYDFDQRPDLYIISVDGESDANIRVYLGAGVGGPYFPLGVGGKLKVPAQSMHSLTLTNVGTSGTAYGAVVGVKGFPDFDIDFAAASALQAKGGATTFSVVSVPTGGGALVLAANPRRKSALFQNLGANQITLGKSSGVTAGNGIVLSGTGNPTFNDTSTSDAWYAIAVTGATNLLVMEIT